MLCAALLSLISCGSNVVIPDLPVHWDLGEEGAHVIHFNSEVESVIPKDQWDKLRFGYGCISQASYGEIVKLVEILCLDENGKVRCTKEERATVQRFLDRVKRLKARKGIR